MLAWFEFHFHNEKYFTFSHFSAPALHHSGREQWDQIFLCFSFIAEKEVNVDKRLHLQRKYLSLFRKVKQWITFTRTFRHKTCSFQRIFGIFCLILTSPSQVDEANISKIDGFTGGHNSSNLKVFKWIQFISFSVAA